MGSFLDISLAIECPKCGSKSKRSLRWIKAHDQYVCHCGHVITLKTDELGTKVKAAEKGLADLQELLKKVSPLNDSSPPKK